MESKGHAMKLKRHKRHYLIDELVGGAGGNLEGCMKCIMARKGCPKVLEQNVNGFRELAGRGKAMRSNLGGREEMLVLHGTVGRRREDIALGGYALESTRSPTNGSRIADALTSLAKDQYVTIMYSIYFEHDSEITKDGKVIVERPSGAFGIVVNSHKGRLDLGITRQKGAFGSAYKHQQGAFGFGFKHQQGAFGLGYNSDRGVLGLILIG
ncbi:hypothetical protein Tco_0636830 [Tanacetum coccineum]